MSPYISHLIGDFILQNEWMAINKKTRTIPCLIYVLVYILPFLICHLEWWQLILIGIQHFAQDRTDFVFWWLRVFKRVNPESWKELPLYLDQAFHFTWINIVILFGNQGTSILVGI
ncbi:DUF3307 domain-containing protein [Thermodesulfobacteriota bacterium]